MGASQNKLFLPLGDRPIVAHTIAQFQRDEACRSIIVAIKEEERLVMEAIAKKFKLTKITAFVEGGEERQHSVHACLQAFEGKDEDIVLVHDGARPFIRHETIHALVQKAKMCKAAIAAVRAKDTMKVVRDQVVESTLDRSSLWSIQTPQAFRYDVLYEASARALREQFVATDESMLVEQYGTAVHIVESTYDNVKMTTQEDLAFGHYLLKQRGEYI